MVEGHQIEEDGLIWTLTLRDGLRFHDKEPVLARDVVASIRRFAGRISFANALMATTEELSAPDDRTVRFHLKRPFPHLPDALAGPGNIVPAIMPERLAVTSPFKPVAEIVGSGPYRFLPDEHISGLRQLEAQGLALALVSPSAFIALLAYAGAGQVDWVVGLPLALGGMAAISAGVAFASRLPERRMPLAFCALMLLTAVLLALRA